MAASDLAQIPADLPVPVDDGACDHLAGMQLPSFPLASTRGGPIDLAQVSGRVVIFAYPRTGTPAQTALVDDWDLIPGARGCTPQTSAFRDGHDALEKLGATVFGLSTQDVAYQREMAERLELPFAVLSDVELRLTSALRLPTFTAAHVTLLKRVTIVANNGTIEKVFYPVFPPDKNAQDVLDYLRSI